MNKDRRQTEYSSHTMRKKVWILTCLGGFLLGVTFAILMTGGPTAKVEGSASVVDSMRGKDLVATVERLRDQITTMRQEMEKKSVQHAKELQAQKEGRAVVSNKACKGDRHRVWVPSSRRDATDPELAEVLRKVAVDDEVLVAVSNINYAGKGGMLDLWMDGVKRAGVKNALVVALDDATKHNVEERGFDAFRMDMEIPDSQKNNGGNHAVSALKFRILSRFLNLGYSVLLSDVDVLTLDNPFKHLVRDSDVESMSDGWDHGTAYGYNDVFDDPDMGWSRYAHTMRIFVFNSGLFHLRPTEASMALLDKLIKRLESEGGWDQALFNECIFFPSSPSNTVCFLGMFSPYHHVANQVCYTL